MKQIIFLCSLFLLLTGCRAAATPAATVAPTAAPPTATTEPTDTPQPSPTTEPTAAPTATPEPTATVAATTTPRPSATPRPSPSPTIDLGLDDLEEIMVDAGFAFRPFLTGMEMEIQGRQAFFADEAGTFVASLGGGAEEDTAADSLEGVLDDIVRSMSDSLTAEFEPGEPYPLAISGVEGLAVDVGGTLMDGPVLGQFVAARPNEGQIFFAFALGNTTSGDERWTEEGSVTFATLLDSVRFFPIAPVAEATAAPGATTAPGVASACPVATDESYGFSEANAIRVGGGAFGGPSRAEAYLDTLRGPAGQAVTYARIGSQPFEETILDAYEVSYEGAAQAAVLHIDQYVFETLYAPVGFTCAIAFSLTAP